MQLDGLLCYARNDGVVLAMTTDLEMRRVSLPKNEHCLPED
jgi:hypothetical protein